MAVYLFTFHAYRSWMPDNRRGFVRRGKGIQPPDATRAKRYHARARCDRMTFNDAVGEQIIMALQETCERKQWKLLAVVVVWTHVHLIVSWREFHDMKRVRAVLKRAVTVRLRDVIGRHCKWLAAGGSIRRVRDRKHYDHLMQRYLPAHHRYGGRQWYAKHRVADDAAGKE